MLSDRVARDRQGTVCIPLGRLMQVISLLTFQFQKTFHPQSISSNQFTVIPLQTASLWSMLMFWTVRPVISPGKIKILQSAILLKMRGFAQCGTHLVRR